MTVKSHKRSLAGVLITIGIVFGDIGTSPLYVFQAITGNGTVFNEGLIFGGLSAVIWTLILIASIKYMYFALNADNKGEGGIFALFALLKNKRRWVILPALIGCSTLIADGFITPAISISSAVEGLSIVNPDIPVLPIVVIIIIMLFLFQQFGTVLIGKTFGPVMVLWFVFIGFLGAINIIHNPGVLSAFNPYYVYNLIFNVDGGFWVLGAVFLCTTGAEALYSDLGHCGKENIRISWAFVSSMLVLNYLGQAALCSQEGFFLNNDQTIFYSMVPEQIIPFAIGLATFATIIASQALITGVYTLMNEAVKLKLWTNLKVKYPTDHQGQIYIPYINWFLMAGCLMVLFIFKKSSAMEATYGLAITIDMIMTSILLFVLIWFKYPKARVLYFVIFSMFLIIECVFLLSNLGKIVHGGWFTLILAFTFFTFLYLFYEARNLRKNITEYVHINRVIPLLNQVNADDKIPYEATNIVYPTRSDTPKKIDSTVFYSLFRKKPRKAGIIWFLHLDILEEPWGVHYSVNTVIEKKCFFVSLHLGFKEEHRIEYMMRKIHDKMVRKGEIDGESVFECVRNRFDKTDFRFVVLNTRIATDNELTPFQSICVRVYRFIKLTGLKPEEDLGLDKTNVEVEYVPISVTKTLEKDVMEDAEPPV